MPLFPVQDLPDRAFLQVFRHFTIPDLFNLSLCTERSKNLVIRFTGYLRFTAHPLPIKISANSVTLFGWKWVFADFRSPDNVGLHDQHYRLIHGREYLLCRNRTGENVCLTSTPQICTLLFANYLICLFRCQLQELTIGLEFAESLEQIQSWRFLHRSQTLRIEHGTLSHSEMRGFLENFSTNHLEMRCSPVQGFVYDKPISVSTLRISYSSWFTRQNLLSLDCATAELECSTLTGADINAFIHQWLISDNQRLQYLLIKGRCKSRFASVRSLTGYEDLDMKQVLEGLQTIPGTRKRQDASSYRQYRAVPYEKGVDLRRKDGKLATVLELENDDGVGEPPLLAFLFVVWQRPNPFLR